ncbi:VPLPA-CTERM protein sorting domain-containing protein [Poseidonocella pacifica]|uniref:VPLPA-CTERM protein sorting domain-containing protein n=1 Tax=Poseidonocella pacifica TaxID=871651 RepID=A0A1I0YLU4_9RHOB|nr:VPLPA-CTERM sorting domain-containing protein [Poseidonocella pacifica]SFB14369.1 VPLPA-CTERM protein sorting domain-containing protein [Poseidonocella pacifica]
MIFKNIAGTLAILFAFTGAAQAATLSNVTPTSDIYFAGDVEVDYDPGFLGLFIGDLGGLLSVSGPAPFDGTTSLAIVDAGFATVASGTLTDYELSADGGAGVDTLHMLFELSTGSQPYALATFMGDFDGGGTTDFFTNGVAFVGATASVVGATVVPLPASLPLLLAGLGAAGFIGRRSRAR